MGKVEILPARILLALGPQMMSVGCPEFFEVMPLAACRNPEQYKWKVPGKAHLTRKTYPNEGS